MTVRVTVTLTWCVGRRELSGVPSRRLVSSNVQGTAAVRRSQLILRQHQQMAIRSRQQARSLKVTATKSASELSTASTESVARRPTATVRATGTSPWTAMRRGLSTARHRPLVSRTVRRTADVLQECSSPGGRNYKCSLHLLQCTGITSLTFPASSSALLYTYAQ